MEKYGVVLDDEKTKTSSVDERCPKCGGPIEYGAIIQKGFPYCPKCGTEPFEKKPAQK